MLVFNGLAHILSVYPGSAAKHLTLEVTRKHPRSVLKPP